MDIDFLHTDNIWDFIRAKDEYDNPDSKSKDFDKFEPKEQTNELY